MVAAEACAGATGTRPRVGTTGIDGFLRGMFDGLRCGVIAVDRGGRLVLFNDLAAEILELPTVPAGGEPVESALDGLPQLVQVVRDAFAMSSLPNRAELDLDLGAGRRKTLGFTVSLVPGDGAAPEGAAVFFKDLTHIEQKEEQERLRDRLAALGQMAASMAHEIRNPLASIEVTCSLLRRRTTGEENRELLDKIAAEVRRLNRTVTTSLEFVRPVSLKTARADLGQVLDESITVAAERHGAEGVRVERRFTPSMPPFVMDRAQMRQVFENLVLNAFEAVGDRGIVTVETEVVPAPAAACAGGERSGDPWLDADRFAVVRVADTGPGIPPEARPKVLHPFHTTKKNGSGIGLPMAKKIVDSHRGVIDIESAEGGGALFIVRLPMVLGAES